MSKNQPNKGHHDREQRRLSVRGVRREQPDLRKLARALIELAQAQAEAEAQAEYEAGKARPSISTSDSIESREAA